MNARRAISVGSESAAAGRPRPPFGFASLGHTDAHTLLDDAQRAIGEEGSEYPALRSDVAPYSLTISHLRVRGFPVLGLLGDSARRLRHRRAWQLA